MSGAVWVIGVFGAMVVAAFFYMGYRAGRTQGIIEGSARRRYPRDVQ